MPPGASHILVTDSGGQCPSHPRLTSSGLKSPGTTADLVHMDLRRKALLFIGGLVAVTGAGNAYMVTQAVSSQQTVRSYRERTSELAAAVSAMRASFYNVDDQMNMYVLVAATQPDQK